MEKKMKYIVSLIMILGLVGCGVGCKNDHLSVHTFIKMVVME